MMSRGRPRRLWKIRVIETLRSRGLDIWESEIRVRLRASSSNIEYWKNDLITLLTSSQLFDGRMLNVKLSP